MSWNKHKKKTYTHPEGTETEEMSEEILEEKETETKTETETEEGPHWIHDVVEDTNYVTGFKVLPSCKCSECGYHANRPKVVCPVCGAKMHL